MGEVVLSANEVGALLGAHGAAADDELVAEVLRQTSGDPAAVVLAARGLAAGRQAATVPGGPVLGGLPLLSPGLVDTILGPGAWRRIAAGQDAWHRRSDGWYVVGNGSLARAPDLTSEQRRTAARWYADHGQLALAVRWLHAGGDAEAAADVVAASLDAPGRARQWEELADLEAGELDALARSWPDDLVRRRPEALLALVRAVEFGMHSQLRSAWLARLEALVTQDSEWWVRVEAELIRELARQGRADEVHARAAGVLARGDDVARARVLMAESLVDLLHQEESAVHPARDVLSEATSLLRINGEREWEADAWLSLGVGADLWAGRFGMAIEHMERALALCSPGTQLRGRVLTFLAEALSAVGRVDDAEAALGDAVHLAELRNDAALTAYAAWSAAIVASRRGDLATTTQQLRVVESHRGEWYALPAGVAFHAEAAEMLATLGQYDRARAHVEVGRAHPSYAHHPHAFDLAELVLAARDGDPALAAGLAERYARTALTGWRVLLLHAWAAHRGGAVEAAAALADRALAEAELLGHPEVVDACEPELALWARGAAGALPASRQQPEPVWLRLCGSVSVERSHELRAPRPGAETALLAAVAARHRVAVDDVLALLWPSEPDSVSRRRLRNTLNRLRASVGEVVVRRGEQLTLGPGIQVDVHAVLQAAQQRHTVPELRVEAARRALALVVGEVAHGDDPVLDELRDQLGLAVGALADQVADAATTAGELDEAARHLALARRLDRYDETRAVRLVGVLRGLGRDAAADGVLADALTACAELGVSPSPELARLVGGDIH